MCVVDEVTGTEPLLTSSSAPRPALAIHQLPDRAQRIRQRDSGDLQTANGTIIPQPISYCARQTAPINAATGSRNLRSSCLNHS